MTFPFALKVKKTLRDGKLSFSAASSAFDIQMGDPKKTAPFTAKLLQLFFVHWRQLPAPLPNSASSLRLIYRFCRIPAVFLMHAPAPLFL
jgi:hypothetical protein